MKKAELKSFKQGARDKGMTLDEYFEYAIRLALDRYDA